MLQLSLGQDNLQLVLTDTINADQLRLEDQDAVRRNRPRTPRTVCPLGLDSQLPLLARAHVKQTLVPALDHLAAANLEAERLPAVVGGIEFGAVRLQSSTVVHVDLVAGDGRALAVDCGDDFGLEVLRTH